MNFILHYADISKKFRTPVNFILHYADFSNKFCTPVNFIPHYKKRLVRFFVAYVVRFCLPPKTALGKYSLYVFVTLCNSGLQHAQSTNNFTKKVQILLQIYYINKLIAHYRCLHNICWTCHYRILYWNRIIVFARLFGGSYSP